jgi:hypothetical protein
MKPFSRPMTALSTSKHYDQEQQQIVPDHLTPDLFSPTLASSRLS